MAQPASPTPTRTGPGGISTDTPYGLFADLGFPSLLDYFVDVDDTLFSLGITGAWTKSATTTGTAVPTAGDGGRGLFSTAAANNDAISIQRPVANITLPQGTLAGKKAFFTASFQLSDITASAFIVGLCNITATPLTAVADGLYFQKSAGSTTVNLISVIGSAATTLALPAAQVPLANATDIDLGWYLDRYGNVNAYAGGNLYGFVPQSGTGASVPPRGRIAQMLAPTLTTANLSITIAIAAGAVAIKTLNLDAVFAAKER